MSKHQKRNEVPKTWPIPRKGTKFVIKKNSNGVPLLIILRDLMGLAQNRREVKKSVHNKDLLICGKPAVDEKVSLELFDTLTIVPEKKTYRVVLSKYGKFDLEEVSEKESKTKISKIIGKKTIKGKKSQINLLDGKNYLSDIPCNVQESVVVDFEKKSISKVLPIKEGSTILAFAGKHAGSTGKITQIIEDQKMVEIESEDKKFRALIKQIMVLN